MTYKILYKPKGKAGEYCNGYALNLELASKLEPKEQPE